MRVFEPSPRVINFRPRKSAKLSDGREQLADLLHFFPKNGFTHRKQFGPSYAAFFSFFSIFHQSPKPPPHSPQPSRTHRIARFFASRGQIPALGQLLRFGLVCLPSCFRNFASQCPFFLSFANE